MSNKGGFMRFKSGFVAVLLAAVALAAVAAQETPPAGETVKPRLKHEDNGVRANRRGVRHNRVMTRHTIASVMAAVVFCAASLQSTRAQQPAAPQDPSTDLLQQAEQQMRDGKEQQAVALARQAVAASPESYQANNTLGAMLDFAGMYREARDAFAKAAAIAPNADDKTRAERAIAISYGFEGDCTN